MALSRAEAVERRQDLTYGSKFFWLDGWMVRALQGPFVYQLTDSKGKELYIGVKTGQSARPFDPTHHRIGLGYAMAPDDDLWIYPMASREEARWCEAQWLAEHARWMPEFNRNMPMVPRVPAPEAIEPDYLW